jgi:serine/threonine protein kinase
VSTTQTLNFFNTQLSAQIDELLFTPVFKMFTKMKVKKPTFQMIQIDPKNFIVMKETPISKDYDIKNEIGKGGFGSVYKAFEKNIEEMRAVKKIKKKDMDY